MLLITKTLLKNILFLHKLSKKYIHIKKDAFIRNASTLYIIHTKITDLRQHAIDSDDALHPLYSISSGRTGCVSGMTDFLFISLDSAFLMSKVNKKKEQIISEN